ncbi:hypothetical protein BHE90_001488 [Fusarium euwallaceae]|uniref:Uncharacterized protein n=1 Tax=Fusarium euwallaceae TaxID=1147111 RepID=A0A430M7K7_9HYPO|nr:hypothetical protein BHE90_001488 [Fusarium euwallaceae]
MAQNLTITGLGFMGCHLRFFAWLNHKPIEDTLPQGPQAAVSNTFAVLVDIFLLGGLRLLSKQMTPEQSAANKPAHLSGRKIFSKTLHNRLVSFVCLGIPFALIFPPGAVTTESALLKQTLPNVKTMNISDYGNGTIRQFVEYSLFEMNGDLNYNPAWSRPQLKAIAAQVLSSGEPVKIDSPCGSACVYNISLEGPTFHCVEPEAKPPKCSAIYEAEDLVENDAPGASDRYALWHNVFKIIWDPEPVPNRCDPKSLRSLVCRMKLSTYELEIEHSLNASRSIKATIDNHRDAAINALQGEVTFSQDGESRYFTGNASQVLSSPYIGVFDRYDPRLDISAKKIERFFQDVVISTLSIGMSTHQGEVEGRVGTEVYRFSEHQQFYPPYAVSAFVALLMNIHGYLSWRQNR